MILRALLALFAATLLAHTFVAAAHTDKPAVAPALSEADREALELGRKVLAVKRAIANPTAPDAMKSVTALGHDSRYYVMVRGWLTQQLAADQSIADARGKNTPKKIQDRIGFLKKAIRAIDLE